MIGLRYTCESITEVNCSGNHLLRDFVGQSEEIAQNKCRLFFGGCDCLVARIVPKFALRRTRLVVKPTGVGIAVKKGIDGLTGVEPAEAFIVDPKARISRALQVEPTVVEVVKPPLILSVKITEPRRSRPASVQGLGIRIVPGRSCGGGPYIEGERVGRRLIPAEARETVAGDEDFVGTGRGGGARYDGAVDIAVVGKPGRKTIHLVAEGLVAASVESETE